MRAVRSEWNTRSNGMENPYKDIIAGGGLAGASAVEGIRDRDRLGSIALFGNENQLPYDRPPLSKGLWLGKSNVEDLPVHNDVFYSTNSMCRSYSSYPNLSMTVTQTFAVSFPLHFISTQMFEFSRADCRFLRVATQNMPCR